ncbi:MAG: diphosphomevalonate decarboxylase [Oligoflexia bacterium]|nr:diphosphomevalonate decarboxylase [Oligoflexia bacterium]
MNRVKKLFELLKKQSSKNGIIRWRAPSNIALIKYWGKKNSSTTAIPSEQIQLPATPSISFTLKHSYTDMVFQYELRDDGIQSKKQKEICANFSFDSFLGEEDHKKSEDAFAKKINKFFKNIESDFPFLRNYKINITSSNSFPHSAGIASSASSMAALALAVVSLDAIISKNKKVNFNIDDFFQRASQTARIGSGSAARSVYGNFVLWGENNLWSTCSDLWATPVNNYINIHDNFSHLMDAILIVDSSVKKVSSSVGHSLMNDHPFREGRYQDVNKKLKALCNVLTSGDYLEFIKIVESEALTLHALMMSSTPSYLLLKAESLILMEKIIEFRKESKIPVCFTIDAGPNIHLIYPANYHSKIKDFIELELAHYLDKRSWISDEMGEGPSYLT